MRRLLGVNRCVPDGRALHPLTDRRVVSTAPELPPGMALCDLFRLVYALGFLAPLRLGLFRSPSAGGGPRVEGTRPRVACAHCRDSRSSHVQGEAVASAAARAGIYEEGVGSKD